MIGQPPLNLRVLVGGVIVEDRVNDLAHRHGPLHRIEKGDELLMAVLVHASAEHGAIQHIECGEQCGGAVALVIMGHGLAFAGLERKTRLGAVQGLDLALFIDGEHDGVTGRGHVQPHHILDLLGKSGIARQLEGAQPMRLKPMGFPNALHRSQADADGLGDRASRPMCGVARRFRARQCQHLRDGLGRQRRPAGFARLITQQPIHALLGIAQLPAPHRRPAGPAAPGNLENRQALGRMKNDPRPLHMLLGAVAIRDQTPKLGTIFHGNHDADSLNHPQSIALKPDVNLVSASVH